ncbi:protocadherin gamma-C3 isoform X27 [Columba livia]|uniref:protocadherin gamma-C3 isoform X27 n=1 Tax=Columba livia TaxID=8932 RepID=UPI0031BB8AD7
MGRLCLRDCELWVEQAGRAALGSARCLQCREEAAGAAVDRAGSERKAGELQAAPPAAARLARCLGGQAVWERPAVRSRAAARRRGRRQRTGAQAQPNTDWRFSQTQRPGTSGSQNGEEGGAWPNNQFDTEMLQAMILASANEAADANSTLGGGTGTMGLSARYGPQFTLQHVPDYRQNVYIPGSTATLTNAAGKRDAKSAASSGGNKKKSGKKEKK